MVPRTVMCGLELPESEFDLQQKELTLTSKFASGLIRLHRASHLHLKQKYASFSRRLGIPLTWCPIFMMLGRLSLTLLLVHSI